MTAPGQVPAFVPLTDANGEPAVVKHRDLFRVARPYADGEPSDTDRLVGRYCVVEGRYSTASDWRSQWVVVATFDAEGKNACRVGLAFDRLDPDQTTEGKLALYKYEEEQRRLTRVERLVSIASILLHLDHNQGRALGDHLVELFRGN